MNPKTTTVTIDSVISLEAQVNIPQGSEGGTATASATSQGTTAKVSLSQLPNKANNLRQTLPLTASSSGIVVFKVDAQGIYRATFTGSTLSYTCTATTDDSIKISGLALDGNYADSATVTIKVATT
jgi:hypothetical protein